MSIGGHQGTTCDIITGDCLSLLRDLPTESVQCCVTSPPYWGLRDYGVDGQIGAEASLEDFMARLVAVFREVRRALKPDGVAWINMGDSYAGARGGGQGQSGQLSDRAAATQGVGVKNRTTIVDGLKSKDLVGQPWALAFALRADGWYLRQDIIWAKPAPMPESVRDRCTKAHEYLFLLSKSQRYYWDAEAMKEPATFGGPNSPQSIKSPYGQGFTRVAKSGNKSRKPATERGAPAEGVDGSVPWEGCTRNKRSVWTVSPEPFADAHFATFPSEIPRRCILASTRPGDVVLDPFGGSGTTGMVAVETGRSAILYELNPAYAKMALARCRTTVGLPLESCARSSQTTFA